VEPFVSALTDIFVSGGTYSAGTAFNNSTGGTFNVAGFYTGALMYLLLVVL
jgi:hypothetical protein